MLNMNVAMSIGRDDLQLLDDYRIGKLIIQRKIREADVINSLAAPQLDFVDIDGANIIIRLSGTDIEMQKGAVTMLLVPNVKNLVFTVYPVGANLANLTAINVKIELEKNITAATVASFDNEFLVELINKD